MLEDVNVTTHSLLKKKKKKQKSTTTELLITSQIAIAQLLGSQNHRRAWVGRVLKDLLVLTSKITTVSLIMLKYWGAMPDNKIKKKLLLLWIQMVLFIQMEMAHVFKVTKFIQTEYGENLLNSLQNRNWEDFQRLELIPNLQ